MAALTNPGSTPTEFSGEKKVLFFDGLAIGSASDTLTLTAASNGISSIDSVMVSPGAGHDVNFSGVSATFSGLVITIVSLEGDGTASTSDWGSVSLWVIGS